MKTGAASGIAAALLLASPSGAPFPAAAQERYDPTARGGAGRAYDPLAPQGETRMEAAPGENPRFDPEAEYSGLPATEGADTVFTQCTYCHSAAIIMQQRLSRERWDDLITWMSDEHGMPELEPEDRQVILDYLRRHFSGEAGKS